MSSLFFVLGREPFKRGQRGLFGGKARITGNNVSFSERKTKRVWLPNVQTKRLYSDALEQPVQMKVTTYVLRCIDKAGGLDNYLLNTHPKKIASEFGLELREKVLTALIRKQEQAAVTSNVTAADATLHSA